MIHALSDDGFASFQQTSGAFLPTTGGGRHVGAERTVVVHRLHDPKQVPSPVDQLLTHARTIVPAVLNYIYFGAADMAVVYFGKTVRNGQKFGVDGADDMKIRMLRFLTTEIWPQLLRTDVPDESQATADAAVDSPLHNRELNTSMADDIPLPQGGDSICAENAELAASVRLKQTQRQQWLRKSLESGMQVLVYLKPGANNTKYLKLVLSNSPRRIHFDIAESREEKFRWDNRMLHIRMLDNLETQKAIDSYETYERYFKEATAFASKHCAELEKPDQPLVSVVFHDGFPHPEVNGVGRGVIPSPAVSPALTPRSHSHDYPKFALLPPAAASPATSTFLDASQKLMSPSCSSATERSRCRRYAWFENLEKPESLTLDYKSYFMHPAVEIHFRAVKFMCGFLNGIGQGKLVVGVHEMERADLVESQQRRSNKQQRNYNSTTAAADKNMNGNASLGESPPLLHSSSTADLLETTGNTIVTHNMLIEQLVVGIAISDQEIAALQIELSEQLQLCIPPIPPQAVQLDIIPIVFPVERVSPGYLVLFYDTTASGWKDGFRQKGNNAIRQLRKFGFSLCPYDFTERNILQSRFPKLDASLPKDVSGFQLYAVCPTAAVPPTPSTTTTASSKDAFPAAPALSFDDGDSAIDAHQKPTPTPASPDRHQQLSVEWLQSLMDTCAGRNKGKHVVYEMPHLILPELRIVEISVNIARCPEPLRSSYKGKFFNGWPSIPIWNPMTDMITRVDRNYHIFSTNIKRSQRSGRKGGRPLRTSSPAGGVGGSTDDTSSRSEEDNGELQLGMSTKWYVNASIVATVLAFSCGGPRRTTTIKMPRALLRLRLLHSAFNTAFEMSLGVPLVEMLRSTPVGSPGFIITRETVSLLQTSLRVSRLSTLPLLLVHVYEMLGSLLSPFPYVSAPVSMQSIRLHPKLLPLYMYHDYEAMTFRMDIVLDTEDGLIKVIRGSSVTGAFTLEVVQGIGFAKVSRKLLESRAKQASLPKAVDRARSLRRIKPAVFNRSSAVTSLNTSVDANGGMAGVRSETAEYLTPRTSSGSGMASAQTSSGGEPPPFPGVTTVRKLESNVPLLRFSFLYGDHQKLFHSNPWTLATLLNWLHAAAHSPNVRPFGHCDRSFGYYPDFTKEVCVAHLGDDELFDGGDAVISEPSTSHNESPLTSVYASSFDCSVCRLMVEWNSSH
jgi:hypothetical protein